jgi:hypothetical protein
MKMAGPDYVRRGVSCVDGRGSSVTSLDDEILSLGGLARPAAFLGLPIDQAVRLPDPHLHGSAALA